MTNNNWIKDLEKKYDENKLAHSFLLETDNIEICLEDLKKIIKKIDCPNEFNDNCQLKCNNCQLIDENIFPNLMIVRPDGNSIKKEQVLNIKSKFNKAPIMSKYNIYVLVEADKLNESAANAMLKFIEEPESPTICFLITNNVLNVLSTIKSRCQIIKCIYNKIENIEFKYEEELVEFLKNIENQNYQIVIYKNYIQNILEDKKELINFFENILDIYNNAYNFKLGITNEFINDNKFSFVLNNSINNLITKIRIINETIQKLAFNVNIELLVDKFLIEMGQLNE